MNAIGKLVVVAAAAAVAWALVARGQQQDRKDPGRAHAETQVVRVEDMTGKSVWTADQKTELGTVKDVVVDIQKGRAVYAAATLKEKEDMVAGIPIEKLHVVPGEEKGEIKAFKVENPEVFTGAPQMEWDAWDVEDRSVLGRLAGEEKAGASLARVSAIGDPGVFDAQGERLGEVDAYLVNLKDGRLLALVGVGGVLGVGEKRHVVPHEALKIRERDPEGKQPVSYTLNVPRATLEKGPILEKDKENRLSDPAWMAGLYEHYEGRQAAVGAQAGFRPVTAERLVGADVHAMSDPDDDIGEIAGLAIVPHSGKIAYVAVEHDGELYAVPPQAFTFGKEGDDLVVRLDATEESFEGKRAFDDERWPAEADPSWRAGADGAEPPANGAERKEGPAMILRSSEVLDAPVKDARGDTYGEIEDFIVDLESHEILFMKVGTGGFLGIGEDVQAIPWKAMRWGGDKARFFSVNIDRKTLEKAVEYDEDRLNDLEYVRSVYSAFGLEFQPKKGPEAETPREAQP